MRDKLLIYTFAAVFLIGLVHWVAEFFYLYWTVWWFDNLAHFLGGLAIGLFSFWIFKIFYTFKQVPSLRNVICIIVFLTFVVGLGWEVFESVNDIGFAPSLGETYWQDTSYDLLADILGAIVAGYIIFGKKLYD